MKQEYQHALAALNAWLTSGSAEVPTQPILELWWWVTGQHDDEPAPQPLERAVVRLYAEMTDGEEGLVGTGEAVAIMQDLVTAADRRPHWPGKLAGGGSASAPRPVGFADGGECRSSYGAPRNAQPVAVPARFS